MNLPITSKFQIALGDHTESIIFNIPQEFIGFRTDSALAEIIADLSRSKLTNWLKQGHILINQQQVKPKEKILGGEAVIINPPLTEISKSFAPENLPLNIVYEDSQLLVLDKPAGLTVHPGNGNWHGTLLNGLLYHYPELAVIPRAGIVHRLDKDTTGLMVVARTAAAQLHLIQQLQQRSVSRVYRALVEGHPFKQGIINKNIGRDPFNRLKMTTLDYGGREAITHYRVLQQFDKIAYIECKLETGRTHQIRVHMKNIAHPIVGDLSYGSRKINYHPDVVTAIQNLHRQALHAIKLSFIHPQNGKVISIKNRLAPDMRELLQALYRSESLPTWDESNENNENEDNGTWEIIYAYDPE
jgi:23S rRNA pseudouridine1911/1915/1917 synthase